MSASTKSQPMKRKLLQLVTLWPWIAGCSVMARADEGTADPQRRFKGIGLILVVDAVPGADMRGVVFYDDRGQQILSSSLVSRRNRGIAALGGGRVPLTVRAIWRDNPKPVWEKGGIGYEGPIIGDYTIPIAERIPNEVLQNIRLHGGALRLKFRLKPDGVLFGWDIERPGGGISKFDMPGGDFLETKY
jgi:hypothetical protein